MKLQKNIQPGYSNQQRLKKDSDSTVTALKFMQFDSENASDSIDLKDLASKEIKETEKTELSKDTTIKTEATVIENKTIVKSQPIDAQTRSNKK